jgi:hypothetical protein
MGSSKGGVGNPALFTGGGLSALPPGAMTPSTPNVMPSYASYLPASGMATPESVAAAFQAAPPPPAMAPPPMPGGLPGGFDIAQLRNLLSQEMAAANRIPALGRAQPASPGQQALMQAQFASPSQRAAAQQFPGPADRRQQLSFAQLANFRGGRGGDRSGRTTSGGPGGGYSSRGGGFRGF